MTKSPTPNIDAAHLRARIAKALNPQLIMPVIVDAFMTAMKENPESAADFEKYMAEHKPKRKKKS